MAAGEGKTQLMIMAYPLLPSQGATSVWWAGTPTGFRWAFHPAAAAGWQPLGSTQSPWRKQDAMFPEKAR